MHFESEVKWYRTSGAKRLRSWAQAYPVMSATLASHLIFSLREQIVRVIPCHNTGTFY